MNGITPRLQKKTDDEARGQVSEQIICSDLLIAYRIEVNLVGRPNVTNVTDSAIRTRDFLRLVGMTYSWCTAYVFAEWRWKG